MKALAAKRHPGPKPKLSDKQCRRLGRMLLDGPAAHGYANELWTTKRVADVIRRKWGVKYDPSGVWHLLRRMGWTCQKPERQARERDEEAIVRWRQVDWPRMKKSAWGGGARRLRGRERLHAATGGAPHLGSERPRARSQELGQARAPLGGLGDHDLAKAPKI